MINAQGRGIQWIIFWHAGLAIFLAFVPLFNVVGYEFAFALNVSVAITAPWVGYRASRGDTGLRALWQGAAWTLIAIAPAVAIVILNALFVRNCNIAQGLAFVFLLPVLSGVYGACLGALVRLYAPRSHPWMRGALIAACIVAPLVWTLGILYTQPPIFAYDHLWGYFSGSLYDEVIGIGTALLGFRALTVVRIGVAALLAGGCTRGTRFRLFAPPLALAALCGLDAGLGAVAGFHVNRRDIESELSQRLEQGPVVLHLPPTVAPDRARDIALDHAFRVAQISARLHLPPPKPASIHSYVYANVADKARLMGGADTMLAKPWLGEIHVHGTSVPQNVVAHELTHVLAASRGDPIFGVSVQFGLWVNLALVEGLATAIAPGDGELGLHAWTKALLELDLAPDVATLIHPTQFWRQAPRRAYTVAGSFIRFLLDTRGPEKLLAAYARGDLEAVYGRPVATLVDEWKRYLAAVPIGESERAFARTRFARRSIFARTCAHEIAALQRAARSASDDQAVALYRRIDGHLGTAASRLDVALALQRAGRDDAFAREAETLLRRGDLSPPQVAALQEARGNLFWQRGRIDLAREAFSEVARTRFSQHDQRLHWIRLWALQQSEQLRNLLCSLLCAPRPRPQLSLFLSLASHAGDDSSGTVAYLIARQLYREGSYAETRRMLQGTSPHPSAAVEAERRHLLADVAWRLGDLATAQSDYAWLQRLGPSSGIRDRAADWLERIRWLRAHKLAKSPVTM